MKHDYRYGYQHILLRPLEQRDIEPLRVLRNKNRGFFLSDTVITEEGQTKWFANYLKKNDDIMFAAEHLDHPGVFIGAVAAYDIDLEKGECEVGRIIIDKDIAPAKGMGIQAYTALCMFLFDELGLTRITAEALKTNYRILKVHSRVGFIFCGGTETTILMEMKRQHLRLSADAKG